MVFDNIQVGDKFRDKVREYTVTELTARGLKYSNEPYQVFPARYGPSESIGGELFLDVVVPELWDAIYTRV